MEIKENEVYTTEEAQKLLKISSSTMMRMIKKGLIRTGRAGKQYRILGKEILRTVSPKLEDRVGKLYNKGRQWVHEGIGENNDKLKKGDDNVKS
ncbi:MAG: helix-turn-helix domain-containing protein [bacterium]|nr:helix-turn-helix domain-containing protein [bacterium]